MVSPSRNLRERRGSPSEENRLQMAGLHLPSENQGQGPSCWALVLLYIWQDLWHKNQNFGSARYLSNHLPLTSDKTKARKG